GDVDGVGTDSDMGEIEKIGVEAAALAGARCHANLVDVPLARRVGSLAYREANIGVVKEIVADHCHNEAVGGRVVLDRRVGDAADVASRVEGGEVCGLDQGAAAFVPHAIGGINGADEVVGSGGYGAIGRQAATAGVVRGKAIEAGAGAQGGRRGRSGRYDADADR